MTRQRRKPASGIPGPTAISIKDLVQKFERGAKDPWHLAIVQRSSVWDSRRVARLLDSMLHRYPIGTLICCRTAQPSSVLEFGSGGRTARLSGKGEQLLDGQQRVLAMLSLFAPNLLDGAEGVTEFFVDLSVDSPEVKDAKDDKRLWRLIAWKGARGDSETKEFDANRGYFLSIKRLGDALRQGPDLRKGKSQKLTRTDVEKLPVTKLETLLRQIDVSFQGIREGEHKHAQDRLCALLDCWHTPWIPVQTVELQSPEDVLHVFTRLNMEGVPTTEADIFFAGVKTIWPDAERCLADFCDKVKVYQDRRMDALRLITRLAFKAILKQDMPRLEISRLQRANQAPLIDEMKRLCTRNANEMYRAIELSDELIKLNHRSDGWLRFVDSHLFDHVFAWAMTHLHPVSSDDAQLTGAYLFFGTAARLWPVFEDQFTVLAFAAACNTTQAVFPAEEILMKLREAFPTLRRRRTEVLLPSGENGATNRTQQRTIVNARGRLYLSLAQHLSRSDLGKIDWDHIYAQNLRHRLKWYGEEGNTRLTFHPDAGLIFRTGNLAAIDRSLNRSLMDSPPPDKLAKLSEQPQRGTGRRRLFITDSEEQMLKAAWEALQTQDGSRQGTTEAIRHLEAVISGRELRLWANAERVFPAGKEFWSALSGRSGDSADAGSAPSDHIVE